MISKATAITHAASIINSALSSGSIKLQGTYSNEDAETHATSDGLYLSVLLSKLTLAVEQASKE